MSGNYLPPNPFAEWVGRTVLRLMGWRIEGQMPALDKFVVIGAHGDFQGSCRVSVSRCL